MEDIRSIARALISVSDKSGIQPLATALAEQGVELLSTGGTARSLKEIGLPVLDVSEHTGLPEMMDGRVKTLHPKIHGGILGRRGIDENTMATHSIDAIDLVVVNLYPFEDTIANPECTLRQAIEQIDIGGPTMVRAAAKNHDSVVVIVDPADYDILIDEIHRYGGTRQQTRLMLATKAFTHTARYDGMIANYLSGIDAEGKRKAFGETMNLQFSKAEDLRYGENPHQRAAFYLEHPIVKASIASAHQHQGKALSFNNIADTDAALECVKQFKSPACVIVKHANPCGVAVAHNLLTAYERAYQTDPTSAFGGIIAFNRPLDGDTAHAIISRQFVEVIIAPEISSAAARAIGEKKNVRMLTCGQLDRSMSGFDFKRVNGGLLVQDSDVLDISEESLSTVSRRKPGTQEFEDLLFAWRVAKFVKSNAIVYARDQQTVGIGAGQMSRVYSARIAGIKAADEGLQVSGSVMASDAFFPFRDGIDAAAKAGITAVIQPGGSMRDEEVIQAANEYDMTMVFTGIRHFRH